ncbi:MAG TPA: succinylglutamate desuccinylase/aspartoacylase family protein [Salegentibacter sp.]|nr:succinylglutamate desuccinylase/aspartoacylase family protein [Salegentibacter sp.]
MPETSVASKRLIGKIEGDSPGPTIIFTGGIHGNEPAGIFAIKNVIKKINSSAKPLKGNIYGLKGNLPALENNQRYCQEDLNRLWMPDNVALLEKSQFEPGSRDEVQQAELFGELKNIVASNSGPFYFIDLHTTSSDTLPFLTVNDSLLNRKFIKNFPVISILGIEEYLEGALLSYINELGYVAFGFEGGQHQDPKAIENMESFIYLSLGLTGIMTKKDVKFKLHFKKLHSLSSGLKDIYEILFYYRIKNGEDFKMKPGYTNFQDIAKGEVLATANSRTIRARKNSKILMPLYQEQGDDGFYTVRKIPKIFLKLSALLRKTRVDRLLPFLPGITWVGNKKTTLIVNTKIAKFFSKQIFHLLGYRNRKLEERKYIIKNRESASRTTEYKDEPWF